MKWNLIQQKYLVVGTQVHMHTECLDFKQFINLAKHTGCTEKSLKIMFFNEKVLFFKIRNFFILVVSRLIFGLHKPSLPFWNFHSVII